MLPILRSCCDAVSSALEIRSDWQPNLGNLGKLINDLTIAVDDFFLEIQPQLSPRLRGAVNRPVVQKGERIAEIGVGIRG